MQNVLKQKSNVAIFWLDLWYCWASPLHPKNNIHINIPIQAHRILLYIIYCLSPHFFFQSEYVLHHSAFIRVGNRQTEWRIGRTFIQWGSGISLHVLNLKKMMASLSLALSLLQTCHLPCATCQHFSARRSTFIILHMHAHTSSSSLAHFQFLHLFPHGPPKTLLGIGFLIMKTRESKQYSWWSSDFPSIPPF